MCIAIADLPLFYPLSPRNATSPGTFPPPPASSPATWCKPTCSGQGRIRIWPRQANAGLQTRLANSQTSTNVPYGTQEPAEGAYTDSSGTLDWVASFVSNKPLQRLNSPANLQISVTFAFQMSPANPAQFIHSS